MSFVNWFHSIKIFKLEVYDKKLEKFLKNPRSFDIRYYNDCGLELFLLGLSDKITESLFNQQFDTKNQNKRLLSVADYCIKNKILNAEWKFFVEWFLINKNLILRGNSFFKRPFAVYLFRGINPEAYKDLLKYGNTTSNPDKFSEAFGIGSKKEHFGLSRRESMWASPQLLVAYEHICHNNPSIVVVYKKVYFKCLSRSDPLLFNVWVLKNKNTNFRDTIEAIIRIRYY